MAQAAYEQEASLDLLISQWQSAPKLAALVEIWLDVVDEEILQPLNKLREMQNIDMVVGIWLDRMADRVGVTRPNIPATSVSRFGFDDAGVGFGQAPFATTLAALEAREPMGDPSFRKLLKARAKQIRTDGTLGAYLAAAKELEASVTVVDNYDMTVTVTTTDEDLFGYAEGAGAIGLPAGVRRVFA